MADGWSDYWLRFPDENTCKTVTAPFFDVGTRPTWVLDMIGQNQWRDVRTNGLLLTALLNLLGSAVRLTLNLGNGSSVVYSEKPGWLANVRIPADDPLPAALQPYSIAKPAQEKRRFA